MLKFIDENDFLLPIFKENPDGSIGWKWVDGLTTHSGVIKEGMTRTANEVEVNIYDKLIAKDANGEINIAWLTTEEQDAIAAQEAAEIQKALKDMANKSLTVEVDGMTFDANETSRARMMGAILAADQLSLTSHDWKLADNSTATITLDQLKQAHALAMQAFVAIILD